jgi:outer membrane protein assembly factor BamB
LADAFFLGPPLPLDGHLYVLVEISGDILLCCLDPANGNEIWRQHLVAIESGGIDSDAIRRVAGAMPTYHEGRLICPTGAGACVAINLIDRTLAWGAIYERSNDMMRVNNRGRGLESTKLMQRWDNGIAVGWGTRILVTPPETERMLALDLLTGKNAFPYKNRVNMRYLAGIRDGKFLLVGATEVRAYDIDTGNLVWSNPQDFLAAGQYIAGRGIFGDDDFIVPTTTGELVRLSLKDGSVLQRRSTRYPLGNLIAVEGDVIVQSPTMLAVAFGEKTLEPIVDRRLAANPDDFDAMVRKSELLIQTGKRREALNMLRRARQQQSDNDEVHLLSVSAMLGMLREDPELGDEYIDELNNLIDRPEQRVELLSLRIQGAMKQEQWVKASEQALALSNLLLSESEVDALAKDILDDPTRSSTLDCWLAARVAEIYENADESDRSKINHLIRQSASEQLDKPNQTYARWIRHFGDWQGVSDARDTLLARYRTAKEWLTAERLSLGTHTVETLMENAISNTPQLVSLAQIYAGGGMPEDAIAVLSKFSEGVDPQRAEEESDQESKEENSEEKNEEIDAQLQLQIEALREIAKSKISNHEWPSDVSLDWKSPNIGNRIGMMSKRTAETTILSGDHFARWRLTNEGAAPLAMRNPYGLSRLIAIEGVRGIDSRENEAVISGGTMIVTMSTGLVCVDLFRMLAGDASVQWRHALGGDGDGLAKRAPLPTPFGDQVYRRKFSTSTASPTALIPEFSVGPIIGDRCFALQGGDLIALDLISGEILWRNSDAPKNGMVVSDGQRVAVVSDAAGEVVFFAFGDGQKLQSKTWTHGKLWKSAGQNVLSYEADQPSGIYQIKLTDPFADAVRLQQQSFGVNRTGVAVPAAYGKVIEGRFLCWMQSDGQALIWDIAAGKEIARPKLPAYDDLQGLSAMRLEDRFFLLPKRKIVRTDRNRVREVATTSGIDHQTIHAIFAIDAIDGELQWSEEFESPWGCTLNQSPATPLLILTRSPYVTSVSTRVRKKYMDMLALDVNDGRTVIERLEKDIKPNNNQLQTELVVQPGRDILLVKIGNDEQLTFKFGITEKDNADKAVSDEIEAYEKQLELELQIPIPGQ